MNNLKKIVAPVTIESPQTRLINSKKKKPGSYRDDRRGPAVLDSSYVFKTRLGLLVKKDYFKNIEQLLAYDQIREPKIVDYFFRKQPLTVKVLNVNKVCHTLRAGKIYQYQVIVGIGNGAGLVGLGVGKSKQKNIAIVKAHSAAKKDLYFLRSSYCEMNLDLQGTTGTITHHGPSKITNAKKGATVVQVSPLLSNSVTASKHGQAYCALGGFTKIKISLTSNKKVKSKLNYYTALHQAIKKQAL